VVPDILQTCVILAASVVILARSSALVVDNAVKLSQFFKISQIALGFLLISVATSLPELSVSVISSTLNEGAIAAGNVFGANIANILLVLGLGGFLHGIRITHSHVKEIGLVLLLTTILSAYMIFNSSVQQTALGFIEGAVLLGIFGAYAWHTLNTGKLDGKDSNGEVTKHDALKAFLLFSAGILLVLVSSSFVVESAVSIAGRLGVAESFIGATVIAIGTTLPEMSVNLQAIRKKRYGIALGNATGSILTNITLVLGTAAVINPVHITLPVFIAALLFAVIANMSLLYVAAVNKGMKRLGGALFLLLYVVYVMVIFALQFRELGAG
jgi:cation:H+ antiporter